MVTISKERVAHWMLISYKADIRNVKDKIVDFEKKYGLKFNKFEHILKNDEDEDFEKWDDYMEWKAFEKSLITLNQAIDEISRGQFKVA